MITCPHCGSPYSIHDWKRTCRNCGKNVHAPRESSSVDESTLVPPAMDIVEAVVDVVSNATDSIADFFND